MIKVASCDKSGSVFLGEQYVYRSVAESEAKQVLAMLDLVGENFSGLIETEVAMNEELPAELNDEGTSLVLRHRKVRFISYPHEWCASMLKDAALFHLELSQNLLEKGLYLKDAHPWNILFDSGRPVFVDITSLVTEEGLFSEQYLEANSQFASELTSLRLALVIREIFDRMFLPYFLAPLVFYATGERETVRARIENTTINASTSLLSLFECLPRRLNRHSIRKFVRYVASRFGAMRIYSKLISAGDLPSFYSSMSAYLDRLPVTVEATAYSQYYSDKGEEQSVRYSEDWNHKQKEVHDALDSSDVGSVLDVACNTGWFALMAENLGKSVVAFDIDESCVDVLYQKVSRDRLNILPLVMNFTQLTKNRYSIHDGNLVLIDAIQRLRSDAVMVLGIIHHLVLGVGMSFEEVLEPLLLLSGRRLIIEFVDSDDDKIKNEPSFFPAYFKDRTLIDDYDINKLIRLLEERNCKVNVRPSYPDTRKMLICQKQ